MEALDRLLGPLQLRRRQPSKLLRVLLGMGTFLALAETYNGAVSSVVGRARRLLNAFFTALAEHHGGYPLWSHEADRPPSNPAEYLWHLPRRGRDAAVRTASSIDVDADCPDEAKSDCCAPLENDDTGSNEAPTFFMSTKIFGCLDLEESQELFRVTKKVVLQPREVLFRAGDSGEGGIFIVMEGELGVYMQDGAYAHAPVHTNTLHEGESVGDLDILDGARRSVTCMALTRGAVLLQVPRDIFLSFIDTHPRALHLYLSQALSRLWRVAHFVLSDFLKMGGGSADATDTVGKAAKLAAGNSGAVAAEAAVQAPAGPSPLPPQPAAEGSASGPAQEQATPNDTAGTHTSPATGPSASSGLGRQRVSYSETFKQLQKLAGPACMRRPARRGTFMYASSATLAGGWDVVGVEDAAFSSDTWRLLCSPPGRNPAILKLLSHGEQIDPDSQSPSTCFFIVVQGHLLSERPSAKSTERPESAVVSPGSLVGGAAFLTHTSHNTIVRATEPCVLVAIGQPELERILAIRQASYLEILLTAGKALGPKIRRFLRLGLNRVWLRAGEYAFRQGEPANCLFINISGRLQSLNHEPDAVGGGTARPVVESEWGRGEVMGGLELAAGGVHHSSARAVRDCELVRMSQGAWRVILTQSPVAVQSVARATVASVRRIRKRGRKVGGTKQEEVVTIAVMPTGSNGRSASQQSFNGDLKPPAPLRSSAAGNLCKRLKDALEKWGPVLHLSSASMQLAFPTASERLHTAFYRSKVTSWMAQQEEDFRFILLETDAQASPWSQLCVSQADCVLLTANAEAHPTATSMEEELIVRVGSKRRAGGCQLVAPPRRTELVLIHSSDSPPIGTAKWLDSRPYLKRHHHVRPHNPIDMARLARWMAGKAVGLVLSGGGSRGLAHLGVLHALDDAGLEVDVVGGTSQGAFMAALYSQGLTWDLMLNQVRQYASRLGSVHHLLSDLTLPLLSLFSGDGFDQLVQEALSFGPQRIEDTWLQYFCITTNLNQGEAHNHQKGDLTALVRASMTIVGLVPPVCYEGELHVDGGYLNNIPVAEMYARGVGNCIVVDVEDKEGPWKSLQCYDGGVSGWKLLWDRWCPLPSLRFGYTMMPRYNQLINALTWMGHTQNMKQVKRDFHIDLYLRPPGIQHYKLMDYNLMDRIVRDAYRYGWGAVTEWQCQQGLAQAQEQALIVASSSSQQQSASGGRQWVNPQRMQKAHSLACMSQLQQKQAWIIGDLTADLDNMDAAGATDGGDSRADAPSANRSSLESEASSSSSGGGGGKGEGGREKRGAGEQPPSESGCSNVLPLYQIPESASVQDHPQHVSQALTHNGRRLSLTSTVPDPPKHSIAPGFTYSAWGRMPLGVAEVQAEHDCDWRRAVRVSQAEPHHPALADVSFPMDMALSPFVDAAQQHPKRGAEGGGGGGGKGERSPGRPRSPGQQQREEQYQGRSAAGGMPNRARSSSAPMFGSPTKYSNARSQWYDV